MKKVRGFNGSDSDGSCAAIVLVEVVYTTDVTVGMLCSCFFAVKSLNMSTVVVKKTSTFDSDESVGSLSLANIKVTSSAGWLSACDSL